MKDTPSDWPRISAAVFYEDAAEAIDWLCKAFGFEVRLRIDGENGRVEHSELVFGDGLVMVGNASTDRPERAFCKSPMMLGGANTQALCIYVDDVDVHHERAKSAGANIVTPPKTDDYGEAYGANRSYEAVDPEGHHWWFMHRVRPPKPGSSSPLA